MKVASGMSIHVRWPLGTPPALGQVTVEVHGLIPGRSARKVDLQGPRGLHSRSKALIGFFMAGNSVITLVDLHVVSHLTLSKMCGSFPAHGATAKAVAKKPQSLVPVCIWTMMYLILNDGSGLFMISAATCLDLWWGWMSGTMACSWWAKGIGCTHPVVPTDMPKFTGCVYFYDTVTVPYRLVVWFARAAELYASFSGKSCPRSHGSSAGGGTRYGRQGDTGGRVPFKAGVVHSEPRSTWIRWQQRSHVSLTGMLWSTVVC